jgi:hypothetical protein
MTSMVISGSTVNGIGTATSAPTLGDLVTQIADEIDDTTGEYSTQIHSAIRTAIRYCERENWYFNQSRDVTFVTVDGQHIYTAADNANIPTLVQIQYVYSEDGQGQRTELRRVQSNEMEILSDNSAARGEPYCWAYFNQSIRLYPIPGATVYTMRLQVGPYRLAPLGDETDSNAWIVEAFDMIKARAKYVLYKDVIKDPALAAEALNDYNDQWDVLKRETSRRLATGVIRATCF